MRRAPILIPAAAHLRPFSQGHVSSLCGLYSLLNAIQLALWPHRRLTHAQLKILFIHGVEHLDRSDLLTGVLRHGIEEDAWLELGRSILSKASKLTGLTLRRHFFLQTDDGHSSRSAMSAIKRQIRLGRPVISMLWGAYDHATVISGYDRSRLILFDSSGFHWIAQAGVGLHSARSAKRHQLSRKAVIALSVAIPR